MKPNTLGTKIKCGRIGKRLGILRDFPLLALNQAVQGLAAQFLTGSNLPPKAKVDNGKLSNVER